MTDETKNRIIWLFAKCIAFVLVFMIVAIVGGFYTARIIGLSVDTDRFYNTVGPAFFMILGAVLNMFPSAASKKPPEDKP